MVAAGQVAVRPVFIESPSGHVFAVYYPPVAHREKAGAILYVPPFAEEMNRSRRVAALQARAFAAQGIGTLLLDLYGTGDSDGDFRDATVPRWLDDIKAAADWLDGRGAPVSCLWGLRLGALLAYAAAAREPERFRRLVLWQPVTDGKTMLTQFLRIRVAASMGNDGGAETTANLRAQLAGGRSVEVAGYEISPELAQGLDQLRMAGPPVPGVHVDWLEIAAEASDGPSPAGQRIVDAWRAAGSTVSAATASGDPFWAIAGVMAAPGLIAATAPLI